MVPERLFLNIEIFLPLLPFGIPLWLLSFAFHGQLKRFQGAVGPILLQKNHGFLNFQKVIKLFWAWAYQYIPFSYFVRYRVVQAINFVQRESNFRILFLSPKVFFFYKEVHCFDCLYGQIVDFLSGQRHPHPLGWGFDHGSNLSRPRDDIEKICSRDLVGIQTMFNIRHTDHQFVDLFDVRTSEGVLLEIEGGNYYG